MWKFKCGFCEEIFEEKDELKNHISIHPESGITKALPKLPIKRKNYHKPYDQLKRKVCVECGWTGVHIGTHMIRAHGEAKFNCPYDNCQIVLNDKFDLKSHIEWVHEKLACEKCGEMVGKKKMNRHIAAKHTSIYDRKYKCDVCGKGFINNSKLNDHKNVHTGEKPYKCQYCKTGFANRGTLRIHERSHLGHHRSKPK